MKKIISLIAIVTLIFSCGQATENKSEAHLNAISKKDKDLSKYEVAYFASGCFWCVEAIFESVIGVEEAVSGYSGGKEKNPTYKQVSAGITGHTESVKVYYDKSKVSYETLVKVYYGSHNPTTVNGQSPDFGTQYRSAIFYQSEEEKQIIQKVKSEVAKGYDDPIATEVVPFEKFWDAEDYHQDFERLNPNQGYVRAVSIPRLKRFQKKFPEIIKPDHKK